MKLKIGDVVKYTEEFKKTAKGLKIESEAILNKSYIVEKLYKLTKKPSTYVVVTRCGTKLDYSGNLEKDVKATRKLKIKTMISKFKNGGSKKKET